MATGKVSMILSQMREKFDEALERGGVPYTFVQELVEFVQKEDTRPFSPFGYKGPSLTSGALDIYVHCSYDKVQVPVKWVPGPGCHGTGKYVTAEDDGRLAWQHHEEWCENDGIGTYYFVPVVRRSHSVVLVRESFSPGGTTRMVHLWLRPYDLPEWHPDHKPRPEDNGPNWTLSEVQCVGRESPCSRRRCPDWDTCRSHS